MFYHDQCKEVVDRFKRGMVTKAEAFKRLEYIENAAYRLLPNAEPDGDITYCVACAVERIDGHNKPLHGTANNRRP